MLVDLVLQLLNEPDLTFLPQQVQSACQDENWRQSLNLIDSRNLDTVILYMNDFEKFKDLARSMTRQFSRQL